MDDDTRLERVATVARLKNPPSDFAYWQTQSHQARLAALEAIREEYHRWKGDAEQGFQRVYSIVER